MPHRYLVIDDHPLMRDAVRTTLETLHEEGRVETANSLNEALTKLSAEPGFDLALLDLHLPDTEGFEGLKRFRDTRPECPVVVLSGEVESSTILKCLEMGAAGYIPKTLGTDAVMNALRLIVSGNIYVPQQAIASVRNGANKGTGHFAGSLKDPRELGLTDRQIDVLRLILRGLPNKLICRQLKLAEGTVKVHVSAVLRALGARTRTQAVVAAGRLGLRVGD